MAAVCRTSREKDALESKSKVISKTTVSGLSAAPPSRQLDHDKEDLRQINFRLEEEVFVFACRMTSVQVGNV